MNEARSDNMNENNDNKEDKLVEKKKAIYLKKVEGLVQKARGEMLVALDGTDGAAKLGYKLILLGLANTEEPATKRQRTNSSASRHDGGGEVEQQIDKSPKIPTLKDLAIFIAQNLTDANNELFFVLGENSKQLGTSEDFITKFEGRIKTVGFRTTNYFDHTFIGEAAIESFRMVRSHFFKIPVLEEELRNLFQRKSSSEGTLKWEPELVLTECKSQLRIQIPVDPEKGYAVIISGESGAGKSWFAKRFVKHLLPEASFIYHEISDQDKDIVNAVGGEPKDTELARLYQELMSYMKISGVADTELYCAISELSRLNNIARNESAQTAFEKLVKKSLEGCDNAPKWWEQRKKDSNHVYFTVEKLVIIIDEVGKEPDLARGLVDQVREIYCDLQNRSVAKEVLLVLVGAGLDRFINEDSPDFEVKTKDEMEFEGEHKHFGTDPTKSQVTTVKGPDLGKFDEKHRDICSDILKGTYSRVLATNTRMLTRGVVPVLKCNHNTHGVRESDLSARRIELGSTNIVMDYAARVYMCLNGLANVTDPAKLDEILLGQFGILLSWELRGTEENLTISDLKGFFDRYLTRSVFDEVLKLGLITSDVIHTSKALRYLACKGQTAPLNAQDGVAFEVVLQHHLVSLMRSMFYLELMSKEGKPRYEAYKCERYSLAEAWPPSSSKKGKNLDTKEIVNEEVKMRYESEKHKERAADDIQVIAAKLRDAKDIDLVMIQTVSNVQGADVMVLSKRGNTDVFLDLYQAKHYEGRYVPGPTTKKTIGAFASLGVNYDPNKEPKDQYDIAPTTGSAGYSYWGTHFFVDKLSSALGIEVQIRKRVVAFSANWSFFVNWSKFEYSMANQKDICLWTKETIEPTISALVLSKGEAAGKEEDEEKGTEDM